MRYFTTVIGLVVSGLVCIAAHARESEGARAGQNSLICSRGVANEVRTSIHRRWGLQQGLIVGST